MRRFRIEHTERIHGAQVDMAAARYVAASSWTVSAPARAADGQHHQGARELSMHVDDSFRPTRAGPLGDASRLASSRTGMRCHVESSERLGCYNARRGSNSLPRGRPGLLQRVGEASKLARFQLPVRRVERVRAELRCLISRGSIAGV